MPPRNGRDWSAGGPERRGPVRGCQQIALGREYGDARWLTHGEYDIAQEEDVVKVCPVPGQLPQRLQREIPQLREVGYPSRHALSVGDLDPSLLFWLPRDEVLVRLLVQDDAFPDTRLLQRLVELAQGSLRVVPAAALVDADEGVLGSQCLD